jgi:hypothetical protein
MSTGVDKLDVIYRVCCEVFDLDLAIQTRKRPVVYKRWIYYNIVKEFTKDDYTLDEMSAKVNQTHAMALRAFERKQEDIMNNRPYRNLYFKCLNAVSKHLKATNEIEEMMDLEVVKKELAEVRMLLQEKERVNTSDEFIYELLNLDKVQYQTFKERAEIMLKSVKSMRTYDNTTRSSFNPKNEALKVAV